MSEAEIRQLIFHCMSGDDSLIGTDYGETIQGRACSDLEVKAALFLKMNPMAFHHHLPLGGQVSPDLLAFSH
jgi:hypothetical protein